MNANLDSSSYSLAVPSSASLMNRVGNLPRFTPQIHCWDLSAFRVPGERWLLRQSYRGPLSVLHPFCFVESVPGVFLLEKVTVPPIEVNRLVLALKKHRFSI